MRRRIMLKDVVSEFTIPTEPLVLALSGVDGWSDTYPIGNGVRIQMFSDSTLSTKSNWMKIQVYDASGECVDDSKWVQDKTITPEDGTYFRTAVAFENNTVIMYFRITWEV